MLPIRQRLVQQLTRKGMIPSKANAIATKTLQKSGSLKPGTTQMTEKGERRTAMGAAGRAKDRAAKAADRQPSDYSYNPRTNRATLKK